MPLGWERFNAKNSSPNKNIVFIKPRPGPEESISKEYLERIAAQCVPIMNKHKLSVVSLEEYEPNLEFWGRNFNNGEVIQLVLKSPSSGRWLPFKFVQMVLIHELAHCQQMNHSKAFWAVRNQFAIELRSLWEKGYTGEGFWGKGISLSNHEFSRQEFEEGEVLPENMCGGTYKSRANLKRKARPRLTYKEREERRIKKKFGTNGTVLGVDTEIKLQPGATNRRLSRPRVAASQRGRELRATAALARFEAEKEDHSIKAEDILTDSEDEIELDLTVNDALDINGNKILDMKGQGMVKVCESGAKNDTDCKGELQELLKLSKSCSTDASKTVINHRLPDQVPSIRKKGNENSPSKSKDLNVVEVSEEYLESTVSETIDTFSDQYACVVCSFINNETSPVCTICSNVLKPQLDRDSWKCERLSCRDNAYTNSGDVAFCGICAGRREFYLTS